MANKKIAKLQDRLYLFYSEDGFIDLAIGFVILFFGLSLLANIPWVIGIVTILPLLGWYIAKEKITRQRTGIINQNSSMRHRFTNFYIAILFFGLLALIIILSSIISGRLVFLQYPLSIFGLILALGISSLAMLLHTNRFYIHATIIFLSMTIGEILNPYSSTIDTYIFALLIAAIIILCIGFFITMRFLKKNPLINTRMIN